MRRSLNEASKRLETIPGIGVIGATTIIDGPVPAARGQPGPVGTEGHAVDQAGVPLEGEELLAGLRIPHLHRSVSTEPGQAFAVRAEGHAEDLASVPLEGEEFLAGLGIPHLHRSVLAKRWPGVCRPG